MGESDSPKNTSFHYGEAYQERQAEKYRNRDKNRWRLRIELAQRLVKEHVLPVFGDRPPGETVVVDVGCSIGTFALEFGRLGYRAYGVDFDPEAVKAARRLAAEEGVNAEFACCDIAEWRQGFPPIDVAVCFDIFEHLHDDELGAFLQAIRRQLSEQGHLVFHTSPTEYRWLYLGGTKVLSVPLAPFVFLPVGGFTALTRAYAGAFDLLRLLTTGKTRRDRIKREGHCNPTTKERLEDILLRAGYEIVLLETTHLYPGKRAIERSVQKWFRNQPISHSSIYGVAVAKV